MFRFLLLMTVCLTTRSTMALAEPVIFECEETFTLNGRQKHFQVSVDLEYDAVRVDDAIWVDGSELGNGIEAWTRTEEHIVKWGFSRNGEHIAGTSELDLLTGSYHEWIATPERWFSRGTCTRHDVTS